MRRTFISLIILAIALTVFGSSSAPKSNAKGKPAVSPQPGARCTRLTFGPKEKKGDSAAVGMPGTRCARFAAGGRPGDFLPNRPAKVGLSSSTSHIGPGAAPEVKLNAIACDLDDDTLLYTYSVTGGRLSGDGAEAVWSLNGVSAGTYTVTVEVDDGCGCISFSSGVVTTTGVTAVENW